MKKFGSIIFIIPKLSAGGAEKVISVLANYWAQNEIDVTIITFDDGTDAPFFEIGEKIHLQPLGVLTSSGNWLEGTLNNIRRIRVLRRFLRKDSGQVVISFMTQANILTVLSTFGLNIPVFVCERNSPNHSARSGIWKIVRNIIYPFSSRLIVQTESAALYYPAIIRKKTVVIPNPVMISGCNGKRDKNKRAPNILLAMGRLVKQKGFDLLIEAYSKVSSRHPDWVLDIWGEGPEKKALEEMRSQHGLEEQIRFPGLTKKPHEVMNNSSMFVMSSRYEGFPNVLVEAMACGLPVVSFDCNGPKDIIRDKQDGILVPNLDVDMLAKTLDRMMGNKDERVRLSQNGPDVQNRFGLEKVIKKWESLLSEVV